MKTERDVNKALESRRIAAALLVRVTEYKQKLEKGTCTPAEKRHLAKLRALYVHRQ